MQIAFFGDSLTQGIPGCAYYDILYDRLREHEFYNFGSGGDTVKSLYRRIQHMVFDPPLDIAFVWIGVNDIFGKLTLPHRVYKVWASQPTASNPAEFEQVYRNLLDYLRTQARRIALVPPVCLGEDLTNRWNRDLAELRSVVHKLADEYPTTQYLDLYGAFAAALTNKDSSPYLPTSMRQVGLDLFTLKTDDAVDRVAATRKLHLTLDGVHLNSAGATLVADTFEQFIKTN